MSEHTKEPWSVGATTHEDGEFIETAISALDGIGWVAVCLDFGFYNPDMREANARRIVACVNACAGIDTEKLEAFLSLHLAEGLKEKAIDYSELLKQRDKLLTTLKDVNTWIGHSDIIAKIARIIAEIEATK